MNICIVGWYGTETLGDRSILAGIFSILNDCFSSFHVALGSLYPFLTERTIMEDGAIYQSLAPKMSLKIFCSKNKKTLHESVKESDLILMGGGPIMDIFELEIIEYAFRKAHQYKKKTMLFGCGIGPLYNNEFIGIVKKILHETDCAVFRDKNSLVFANKLLDVKPANHFSYAHDPAIVPIKYFEETHKKQKQGKITVNFRLFPDSCYTHSSCMNNQYIAQIIDGVSQNFQSVELVPMHTFCVGGDDRQYLTDLKMYTTSDNISVMHHPMNLYELYETFSASSGCIGMRYHSIVLQTLLNGNNIIFDYTDKGTGKIQSFLQFIDERGFYNNRYYCLQNNIEIDKITEQIVSAFKSRENFEYNASIFDNTIQHYKSQVLKLFSLAQ